jgi:hypothetical protein
VPYRRQRRSPLGAAGTLRGLTLLVSDGRVPREEVGHGDAWAGERRAPAKADQVAGGRRDQACDPSSPVSARPVAGQIGEA